MAYNVLDEKGELVKRDGKELFGSDFLGVVKGVNLEDRTLRILATDETRDRDGDIIMMKGWRLENYIKNPVFLWAHDYKSVPIGAAIKIEKKKTPTRLILTHKFPTPGVHPFADMILQLYFERVINAGSVGFLPYDWEEIKDDEDEDKFTAGERKFFFGPRKFVDQELLEHSGCAVPANPNALQDSVSRAMKSLDIKYDDKVKLYKVVTGEDILKLDEKQQEQVSAEVKGLLEKGAEYEEETATQVQVPEKVEIKKEYLYEKGGKDIPIKQGDVVIHENGNAVEWKNFTWEDFEVGDPFIGLKNLIEEIMENHMAKSLEGEKEVYRKRAEVLLKIGAVLNKKNKQLLKQASENISEVLKNAEPEESAEEEAASQAVSKGRANDKSEANHFDAILDGERQKQPSAARAKVVKPKTPEKVRKNTRKLIQQRQIAEVNKTLQNVMQAIKNL